MANIKVINPQEWNVHPSEEGAAAYERVGRYIGQAYRQLGGDVQNVADSFAQSQARTTQMNMSADISQLQIDAHQNLSNFLKTADPSDPDALSKWNQTYFQPQLQKLNEKYTQQGTGDTLLDAVTGNRYHDALMDQFNRQTSMIQSSIMDRATGEWSSIQGRYYVQKADETTSNYANLAHDDPTLLPSLLQQHSNFVDTLPVDAATREAIGREGRAHMFDSAGDGLVEKAENPAHTSPETIDQTLQFLQDPANGFYKNMSPGKYQETVDKLQKAHDMYAGINSEVAAQQLPSLRVAAQNGNMDAYNQMLALANNYVGTTPKETALKRAEIKANADADWASWNQVKTFTRMSDTDIQHYLDDFPNRIANMSPEAAKPLIEQRDAAEKYLKQRDTEFKRDPVSYTVNHDGVTASRAQAFEANPNAQTWANYATAATTYQKMLYPDKVPEIVPPSVISNFRQTLSAAQNNEAGARQALDLINQWQGVTGAQWPQVAHELYAKKALTPAQFGAAITASNPQAAVIANDMLKASFMPQKELMERARSNQHTLTEYDDAVQQALAPFEKTMALAPNGGMIGDALYQSVRNYAMLHGDPAQAGAAVQQMLNTKYAFHDSFRVPLDAGLDTDAVISGAGRVLDDIPNHHLVRPDGTDMTPYERAGMAGQWVTNNDESGLILYGPGGLPVKERNAQGRIVPVQLKWADLQKLGQ